MAQDFPTIGVSESMLSGHHTLSVSSFTCVPKHTCSSTYRSRLRNTRRQGSEGYGAIVLVSSKKHPSKEGKQGWFKDISGIFRLPSTWRSPPPSSGPVQLEQLLGTSTRPLSEGPEHRGYFALVLRYATHRFFYLYCTCTTFLLIPVFGNLWPGTKHMANHPCVSMCANKSYPLNAQAILA